MPNEFKFVRLAFHIPHFKISSELSTKKQDKNVVKVTFKVCFLQNVFSLFSSSTPVKKKKTFSFAFSLHKSPIHNTQIEIIDMSFPI